jgi:tRNA (guanine37-N1)-methyltransferase
MWIGVVTLFPEMFQAITTSGITRRAVEKGILNIDCWNPREFTTDKHRTVDDKPYGGGPGMLMKVEPLKAAIDAARLAAKARSNEDGEVKACKVIYLSPQGRRLDQQEISKLALEETLILIAGRYEGIDERIITAEVDEEYSIGDYVLSGGELPAMVMIDAMTRLQPGAVGDRESVEADSFAEGLLDHPHYTRPEYVDGQGVPAVLLSGNHEQINRWRKKQALGKTWLRRPDLLQSLDLAQADKELLAEFKKELDQKRENKE